MKPKKLISIVTPCYNEEDTVEALYKQIKEVMDTLEEYTYEQIFIDNHSTDNTILKLRKIANSDTNIKVIINTRNFGHIRSPFYGILQASGDMVIGIASDLQDPPLLIPEFIRKWEAGYKVVMGVKTSSKERPIIFFVRKFYYQLLQRLSEIKLVENATGFGLYDKEVIEKLRSLNDPYPYFRGLVADLGYEIATVPFVQPQRNRGITKNNFYTLYDLAMLGLTNHSKLPLRLATMLGFFTALVSALIGLFYLVYKLTNWQNFSLGLAPLAVGLFFFASVQLIFLGIIGEYIGAIYTQVQKRPLVVEQERINF
jgi:glycosyltransferase involved in cell wall biosynthesis